VTGHQGGAVARALQSSGFRLRGLTRNPESKQAAALARRGVDVVKGDLDDEATLRAELRSPRRGRAHAEARPTTLAARTRRTTSGAPASTTSSTRRSRPPSGTGPGTRFEARPVCLPSGFTTCGTRS